MYLDFNDHGDDIEISCDLVTLHGIEYKFRAYATCDRDTHFDGYWLDVSPADADLLEIFGRKTAGVRKDNHFRKIQQWCIEAEKAEKYAILAGGGTS